ncbi:hypothetical protein SSTU70S_06303 [Stutzerimonas stutzeri]
MAWIVTKFLLTAAVVVLVSEAAKRSDKLAASGRAAIDHPRLSLIWLYIERQPSEKIANHAWYTFWYVLPTLPMFLRILPPAATPRLLADAAGVRGADRHLLRCAGTRAATLRHRAAVTPRAGHIKLTER